MATSNLTADGGNVIPFPDLMGQMPHRPDNWRRKPEEMWTAQDKVDNMRFRVAELQASADDADLEATDPNKWIVASVALKLCRARLSEFEAAAADTTFHYNGEVYAEPMGRA